MKLEIFFVRSIHKLSSNCVCVRLYFQLRLFFFFSVFFLASKCSILHHNHHDSIHDMIVWWFFFLSAEKKFIIGNQYLWDRSIFFFTLFDDYFSIFIFSSFSSSFIRCLWIIYHWNYRRCCCCCCYGLYFFSLNFSSLWVFCDILHISLSLSLPIHGINWYFFLFFVGYAMQRHAASLGQ